MNHYYNENDPNAAAWLNGLISEGLIPNGVVDTRSIVDVQPADLAGFTQCHWFCGIAGWVLALQLAGWPSDRPVWTGSCPCQPYSVAGRQKGDADERNLWPHFFRLIRECRPDAVFGEQVATAISHGWLDGIQADLEGEGYAVGHCVLGAHSVSAPHIRQRLYWMGNAASDQQRRDWQSREGDRQSGEIGGPGSRNSGMVQPISAGLEGYSRNGDNGNEPRRERKGKTRPTPASGNSMWMGDSRCQCDERLRIPGELGREADKEQTEARERERSGNADSDSGEDNLWSDFRWIECRDGKLRRIPTQSEIFPLADGLPYRVAPRGNVRPEILKGAGNAIVPQVAAEFIKAYMEITK